MTHIWENMIWVYYSLIRFSCLCNYSKVPVLLNINCTGKSSQVVMIIQIIQYFEHLLCPKMRRKLKLKSRRMITGAVCMCATQERPTWGFCTRCALFDLPKHKNSLRELKRKRKFFLTYNLCRILNFARFDIVYSHNLLDSLPKTLMINW